MDLVFCLFCRLFLCGYHVSQFVAYANTLYGICPQHCLLTDPNSIGVHNVKASSIREINESCTHNPICHPARQLFITKLAHGARTAVCVWSRWVIARCAYILMYFRVDRANKGWKYYKCGWLCILLKKFKQFTRVELCQNFFRLEQFIKLTNISCQAIGSD